MSTESVLDLLMAGGILMAFVAAALAARVLTGRLLRPWVARTGSALDDRVLATLRGLVTWWLLLAGAYYALGSLEYLKSNPVLADMLGRVFGTGWLVLAIWSSLSLFNQAAAWYTESLGSDAQASAHLRYRVALIRKSVTVLVLAFGVLYALKLAGVDISPLLASGAIGGLAVALALQDTLANVFAGFYLAINRPVRTGDFVRLESGEEGFVEEIGWRNTKVRLWANNLVVIPNAKLSQSVITNYYLPEPRTAVYVSCGVSYDSDLEEVERVTLEVAAEVQSRVQGADRLWEPVVRWQEFGESAVTFTTILQTQAFAAQYLHRSEFVKALHRRSQQEGIEIPFPIRTVIRRPAPDPSASGRAEADGATGAAGLGRPDERDDGSESQTSPEGDALLGRGINRHRSPVRRVPACPGRRGRGAGPPTLPTRRPGVWGRTGRQRLPLSADGLPGCHLANPRTPWYARANT